MSTIQDLEQEVLLCWQVVEDLILFAKEYEGCDSDVYHKALGISHVYNMRFAKAWSTYEQVVAEHYELKKYKPREVNFD